jgi:hypothetical protein
MNIEQARAPADEGAGARRPPFAHNHTQRRFLRHLEGSQYLLEKWGLPCAPATLARRASVGGGPEFHHFGRWPVYTPPKLDMWAEAKLSQPKRSTSETATP